jgi:hypothetical protein
MTQLTNEQLDTLVGVFQRRIGLEEVLDKVGFGDDDKRHFCERVVSALTELQDRRAENECLRAERGDR